MTTKNRRRMGHVTLSQWIERMSLVTHRRSHLTQKMTSVRAFLRGYLSDMLCLRGYLSDMLCVRGYLSDMLCLRGYLSDMLCLRGYLSNMLSQRLPVSELICSVRCMENKKTHKMRCIQTKNKTHDEPSPCAAIKEKTHDDLSLRAAFETKTHIR